MLQTALVEFLSNKQPLPIRLRLIRNEAFRRKFGLRPRTVISMSQIGACDREVLFAAVRRTFADQNAQRIEGHDGSEISVLVRDSTVIWVRLSNGEGRSEAKLDDLMMLSPQPEERLNALDRLISRLGSTAPDFTALRLAAARRELSDEEIGELLTEAANGVASQQARAEMMLQTGTAAFRDLVPDNLKYFEEFVGPDPGGALSDEYFGDVLPRHWQRLVRADLRHGLQTCLLAMLRDDLPLADAVAWVCDDELWEALRPADAFDDPFSLLGALDLAIARSARDRRFADLADRLAERLTRPRLERADETDVYDLMPPLVDAVLRHLNEIEGGALRPPYWKRLCAWVQAGFLFRLLRDVRIKQAEFVAWLRSAGSSAGAARVLVDLRLEPMWAATDNSANRLRSEVVDRLVLMQARYEASGISIPEKVKEQIKIASAGSEQRLIERHMLKVSGAPVCGQTRR